MQRFSSSGRAYGGKATLRAVAVILSATLSAWWLPAIASAQQADALENAFAALRTYDWGTPMAQLVPIDAAILATYGRTELRQDLENRLLEVLASDVPLAARNYVCRQLAVIGSPRSVPALERLLDDPQLAHLARGALEVIPGPEATAALCAATSRLAAERRLGVIHSLGRRGDTAAVATVTALLDDSDPQLVAASLIALARLPGSESAQAVLDYLRRASPDTLLDAKHAALQAAQRLLAENKLREAAAAFTLLEQDDAQHLRCAALQGLVQAEPERAVARWTAALSKPDEAWQRFAAESIRAEASDDQLAAVCVVIPNVPTLGRVRFFEALRQRPSIALRSAALGALQDADLDVQRAAVDVLGVSGESPDVAPLARLAASAGAGTALREAAERSLVQLRASGVDDALVQLLADADPAVCTAAIRAVVARETLEAAPQLLRLARSDDPSVRLEALTALPALADASMAKALIDLLTETPAGRERELLERAVARSCGQITPPDDQAAPLLAALARADLARQIALLPALGRVGGTQALASIEQAMDDPDAAVREAALRGLCNWPDDQVADRLLELARTGQSESQRTRALRGYARVIARRGPQQPQQVADGLRQALELATRLEDRRLILSRLTAARCIESLNLALSLVADPQLAADALDATVSLAEGMKQSHPAEARAALQQARARTDNPELQLYIDKLLWNMQLREQEQAASAPARE